MSYETLSLKNKIRWAQHQIKCAEQGIAFWESRVQELKEKYAGSSNKHEHNHIHQIKAYLKQSKDDLEYWKKELTRVEDKLNSYNLFQ